MQGFPSPKKNFDVIIFLWFQASEYCDWNAWLLRHFSMFRFSCRYAFIFEFRIVRISPGKLEFFIVFEICPTKFWSLWIIEIIWNRCETFWGVWQLFQNWNTEWVISINWIIWTLWNDWNTLKWIFEIVLNTLGNLKFQKVSKIFDTKFRPL